MKENRVGGNMGELLDGCQRRRLVDSGQLIQDLRIGWVILHQDLELSDCVSNTIERLKGKPRIIVGTAILRIGRQFLLEHLDRLAEKVLSKIRITEEEIGFRIFWRLLQD